MFEAWGRTLYRRRRLTLVLTLALVAFAAVWGTGVFGKLSAGNDFTPPDSQSQREADQAAQRVADEMRRRRPAGVQHREHLIGHRCDAVIVRQIAAGAAGAALIVGDDAVALFQGLELRRPIARRATETGRQNDGRGAGRSVMDVVGRRHLPMWAIVAISTRASFFTSPHWMQ